jgi:hypothetical protein
MRGSRGVGSIGPGSRGLLAREGRLRRRRSSMDGSSYSKRVKEYFYCSDCPDFVVDDFDEWVDHQNEKHDLDDA